MDKLRDIIAERMKDERFELEPCPFCGGKPKVMSKKFFEELDSEHGGACITIECEKCDLELYDHTVEEHDYYIRKFLIVNKWNRRAE